MAQPLHILKAAANNNWSDILPTEKQPDVFLPCHIGLPNNYPKDHHCPFLFYALYHNNTSVIAYLLDHGAYYLNHLYGSVEDDRITCDTFKFLLEYAITRKDIHIPTFLNNLSKRETILSREKIKIIHSFKNLFSK